MQLLFLRLKNIFFRVAVADGDGAHVLDMFLAMIYLADQIGVFIDGLFFVGDGFLADRLHKGGLDLALLENLEKPQGQGRLAGILMDGGNKNILKMFGFFHDSPVFDCLSVSLAVSALTDSRISTGTAKNNSIRRCRTQTIDGLKRS